MKNRIVNVIFAVLTLLCLLLPFAAALLRQKTVNYYENRYAEHFAPFSVPSYLDGSFQDAMESGLADQLPAAQRLKKIYHLAFSSYQRPLAEALAARAPGSAVQIGGMLFYDGCICYYPRKFAKEQAQVEKKTENYNAVFAAHPETAFYIYYVTTDFDYSLEQGRETALVYQYLQDNLTLPAERIARLDLADGRNYADLFLRTDHHWNDRGAYQGYRDILALLAPAETPLVPLEEVEVGPFSGSKAVGRELSSFSEIFRAYRFAWPEMEITINGVPAADYGNREIYLSGRATDRLTYGSFYGDDEGVVAFRVPGNEGKGSLLVVGESYDNAIIKLLAAHFETTYAVDLRYYRVYMGEDFRLGAFLREHGIDRVLLDGSLPYFDADDFLLED